MSHTRDAVLDAVGRLVPESELGLARHGAAGSRLRNLIRVLEERPRFEQLDAATDGEMGHVGLLLPALDKTAIAAGREGRDLKPAQTATRRRVVVDLPDTTTIWLGAVGVVEELRE